jgi:methyl-accepting chemotaxis protein
VIAHPKQEFILELNLAKEDGMKEFMARLLAQNAGAEDYVFKGVRKICGYAPIALTGWGIGATQNADEFLAPSRHLRNMIFVTGLAFLLITVVAVFFFGRSISKPIITSVQELNEAAAQVGSASSQVSSASQSSPKALRNRRLPLNKHPHRSKSSRQ